MQDDFHYAFLIIGNEIRDGQSMMVANDFSVADWREYICALRNKNPAIVYYYTTRLEGVIQAYLSL